MSQPLVSVIIPVYNVEKYLRRCLDSVLKQTYRQLEIILVDDGSTDSSGKIVDEYAKKDARIVVIHQENGGLSNARNHGIDIATGEYLTFIDSDDYVVEDYVEYLYNLLARNDFKAKLALCSLKTIFTQTDGFIDAGNGTVQTLSGKKAIEMMCYHDLVDTCAYAKLAKKELYDHVRFPEGKLFEDIATTYLLFDQCDIVECGFVAKYFYMIRGDSIVTSGFKPGKLDLLAMTDKMAEYVNQKYPELKAATLRRQVYARFSTLNQMLTVKDYIQERNEILSFLKRNKAQIMKNPRAPKRDKLGYLMLTFGFGFYKFAWKFYLKIKTRKH
ncbi:glycosyltransferase family 2 protein [Ligilactobacillus agilis]|uniref:glycosyltransferase family 2 protein n=1 Tax=Ligilactobacillus agilis TaxID=1601 RepID=UPI0022E90F4C|nr:glycosyltransferase family 2 protein [Ligilactobacillus agilis]